METFDFPFFGSPTVEYPDDQKRLKLGRGYTFVTKPLDPIERIFKLNMTGMQWHVDQSGNVDATVDPQTNARALEIFYETHRLHGEFWFPRPGYGNVRVRFSKPLQMPQPEGNKGVIPAFEIELMEVVV
jgi:hypothetical protein